MKELRRAMKMHRIFIVQELKRMMEYNGDFLTGVIGFLIVQVFNLLFLNIIFSQIPNLKGWSFYEILFIYGFSLIPKGIDHMFFDNLWAMGHWLVRKGDFDKYLTRPINPMFHVMAEKFQVDAFGELVVGIGCTGGKHRSVTIAELLDNYFMEKGYKCIVQHRDVKK